jgi:hypothetical protein
MELKFTKEYFLKVVPEWYDPEVLSGEGTLEEQICEFERTRAVADEHYTSTFRPGETKVEISNRTPLDDTEKKYAFEELEQSCTYCLSKSCSGNCKESTMDSPEDDRE